MIFISGWILFYSGYSRFRFQINLSGLKSHLNKQVLSLIIKGKQIPKRMN